MLITRTLLNFIWAVWMPTAGHTPLSLSLFLSLSVCLSLSLSLCLSLSLSLSEFEPSHAQRS
eukprot:COSAG03_NODE_3306_length_2092_cov_17.993477_1_plen_62_part_00